MKLVIDISYYNNLSAAQWDLLATVLDGVIIRLSFGLTEDVMAGDHIEQARRVGLPFAGYHWADPTRSLVQQVDFYKKMVAKHKPAAMFNDYEQYWTDWPAYMRQDLVTAYATRFTPQQLNDFYSKFHIATKLGLDIPVGGYSADWFISKYAPDMAKWVTQENYWEARYFRYYDAAWWTAKKKELGRDFDIQHMKEIAAYARIFKGIGRQFESYVEVKGLYDNLRYHLDWNVFSDESHSRMFGVPAGPPSEPEPEPEPLDKVYVVKTTSWVRDAPNGNKVGYLWKGTKVIALEVFDGWVQIADGQWMGLSVLAEIFNPVHVTYRVTAAFLWKRETPGGKKIGYLFNGQIVTVLEIDANKWGLLEGGGWVYTGYMERVW